MISRWKSSTCGAGAAARLKAKAVAGGGLAIGSKPRLRSTHLRSALMAHAPPAVDRPLCAQYDVHGIAADAGPLLLIEQIGRACAVRCVTRRAAARASRVPRRR